MLWQSTYARFPLPDPSRPLHRIYFDGSASGRPSALPRLDFDFNSAIIMNHYRKSRWIRVI